MAFTPIGMPRAFIVHHTAGRGTTRACSTRSQRGLGVQYVMDRCRIYETGVPASAR
jgi:hypothetical protein